MSGRSGAGRGRGTTRGLGNLEALGIKPGEGIPPPILQPPPLFPQMERKPLELRNSETSQYLLCVKQDLKQFFKQSPFYLKPDSLHGKDIVRYSDKYKSSKATDLNELLKYIPNMKNMMPKELQFTKKPKKHKLTPLTKQGRKKLKMSSNKETNNDTQTKSKLSDQLNRLVEHDEPAESEEEGGIITEDEYDEEIEEEEGDYQLTYFDPGDDFGGDEDDNLDDGPSY